MSKGANGEEDDEVDGGESQLSMSARTKPIT